MQSCVLRISEHLRSSLALRHRDSVSCSCSTCWARMAACSLAHKHAKAGKQMGKFSLHFVNTGRWIISHWLVVVGPAVFLHVRLSVSASLSLSLSLCVLVCLVIFPLTARFALVWVRRCVPTIYFYECVCAFLKLYIKNFNWPNKESITQHRIARQHPW